LPQHLDLHLIRILYLLLVEKNVSRVALKLNQPQPSDLRFAAQAARADGRSAAGARRARHGADPAW
jgi:hypothetical protein